VAGRAEQLEFEVDGSAALDAFNHPYAYAARPSVRAAGVETALAHIHPR